jgi:hypothetical protein
MSFIKKFLLYFFLIFPLYTHGAEFKELRSDHFIINYTQESEDYIYKIKEDAEYLYRKITEEFGLVRNRLWTWENRAKIIIAKDRDEYLNSFKCSSWSGACVDYHNRIIYTYPSQENFSFILSHELTHIIFREYIGYGKLPLWLDEGMATYIEYSNSFQARLIVSLIKQLISENKYISFAQINNIYSLSGGQDVELFYNQSFSMVYFLIGRFGRGCFSEFLSYLKEGSSLEDSLRKAFGGIENIQSFEEHWKKFYLI